MPPTFGTVVNPTRKLVDYLSTHASNHLAKSLIAVATPNFASQLQDLKSHFPDLQTVALAADSVPLGYQRSGFSYLVSEHALEIKDKLVLQDQKSRNWLQSTAAFRLTSSQSHMDQSQMDLALPVANTLFSTGRIAEIYADDATPLSSLHVEVAENLQPTQTITPVKPLTEWLDISSVTDNMLKTLNNLPAAKFLEEREELMNTPDPAVFAELSSGEMVKVVAGGGGLWSPRASMLVLEAPAAPKRGEKLRFWLQLPGLTSDLESQLANTAQNGVVVETVPIAQTIDDEKPVLAYKPNHFLPVFGFGSEHGFMIGDHKHSIVGESVCFH